MAAYQLEDVLISYLFQTLEIPGKRLRRWRDSGELVHRALVELAEFEAYCEVRPDIGPLVKAYKSQAWSNKEAGKIETSSIELVRSTRRFTKASGETEDEGATGSILWSFPGSLPLLLPSSLLQTVCAIRFYLAVVFLGGFFLFLSLTCSVFHHPAFPGSHSYAHPPASFAWFSVALPPLFCLAFSSSPSALSLSATVSRIAT